MKQDLIPQLYAITSQVSHLALWLTILVVVFAPLERLFSAHQKNHWRLQIGNDLVYYFLNNLVPAILLSYPMSLLAWSVQRGIPTEFLSMIAGLPFWARTLLGLVAGETGYYWGHRLSHVIPFLWRFHSIHHSAEQMDFLVHTRAHPIDMVFGRFCGLIPIYMLGLAEPGLPGSIIPALITVIGVVWGFFIHANLKWRFGPLEWLISTPAFHHWHHSMTPINRNYASTLPWLDWIFGTLYLPKAELPQSYGIKAKVPHSLLDQLAYPFEPQSQPQPTVSNAFPSAVGLLQDVDLQTDLSEKPATF